MDVPILEPHPTNEPLRAKDYHPILGVVFAIMAALLLGTFWLFVAKAQRAGTNATAVGFFAHIICFSLMVINVTVGRRWTLVRTVFKKRRGLFCAVSLVGATLSLISIHGLPMSSMGSLGILSSTDILFTLLIGWFFFHERPRVASLIAIMVIVLGAGVRITGGQVEVAKETAAVASTTSVSEEDGSSSEKEARISETKRRHVRRLVGDLCFLGYAILMATNGFLIKRLLHDATWDVVLFGNYSMRLTGFFLVGLATGGISRGWQSLNANHFAALMVVGAGLMLVIQMRVYYQALRMIPVWVTKTFMMSAPVLYFLLDWAAFGKRPGWDTYLGAALVLGGALFLLLTDPLFRSESINSARLD